MIYKTENSEVIFKTPDAAGRKLAVIHENEFVRLSIDPGTVIPAHVLNLHVTFYVINGRGTLQLNSNVHEVAAGDLISVDPGMEREWTNAGEEKLELLVIKNIKGS